MGWYTTTIEFSMTKQQEIMAYLLTVEEVTISEIYQNVSFSYYCNENKHLGALLARMLKGGRIERVKKGFYRIKPKYKQNNQPQPQLKLL